MKPIPEHELRMLARAAFTVQRDLKPMWDEPAGIRSSDALTFVAHENLTVYSEERTRSERIKYGFQP